MDKAEDVSKMEPTMGGFKGREHHYPLRVFYEDTDYVEKGCGGQRVFSFLIF